MQTPMRKSLWWYKLCRLLITLTAFAALLHAPWVVTYGLCLATAPAGGAFAAYLEQIKLTILTDFIWFVTSFSLLLFPLALAIHSVRIYHLYRTRQT